MVADGDISCRGFFAEGPVSREAAEKDVPNMGHVYGKLVDSAGKPISDATVILLHNKYDSVTKKTKQVLLKGAPTTANGEFSFEDLPIFGQLKLKISATGYKPMEQNVSFQVKMPAGGLPKNVTDPAQAMNAMSSAINGFRQGSRKYKNDSGCNPVAICRGNRNQSHPENGYR